MHRRPFCLFFATLPVFTACGEDGSSTAAPTYTLQTPASTPDASALAEQLRSSNTPLLVFAHDDDAISLAAAARKASQQADRQIVGIAPQAALIRLDDGSADAIVGVSSQALATAAIELCLLAVQGISPPPRVMVGARWFSRSNRAAGGQALPSPGEFLLAMLRQQHPEALSQTPQTDVVFRIGVVVSPKASDSSRLATALASTARTYPQLDLQLSPVEFEPQNFNAILVVGRSTPALAAACAEALSKGTKVIGVCTDLPATCVQAVVDSDAASLGRAAAEAIVALMPTAGTVLELGFVASDADRVACRDGLAAALADRQRQ